MQYEGHKNKFIMYIEFEHVWITSFNYLKLTSCRLPEEHGGGVVVYMNSAEMYMKAVYFVEYTV